MPEELLVRYCAPTLAGLKTGSLFSYRFNERKLFLRRLREWNTVLRPRGVSVLPLRWAEDWALVYVVRPAALRADLSRGETRALLCAAGYPDTTTERKLVELMRRLNEGTEFPHEIGLFLGYPAEDVRGFTEHGGKDYRAVGDWKVYGDPEQAERCFRLYRSCTEGYLARWAHGAALETLTVRKSEV